MVVRWGEGQTHCAKTSANACNSLCISKPDQPTKLSVAAVIFPAVDEPADNLKIAQLVVTIAVNAI